MSRVWWRRSFRLLRVVSPSRQPKESLPGELLDWAIKRTHRTMWGKYNLWEWERTRSIVQTERAWNGRERKEEKKNWRTKSGWTSTKPKDKLKFLNSRVGLPWLQFSQGYMDISQDGGVIFLGRIQKRHQAPARMSTLQGNPIPIRQFCRTRWRCGGGRIPSSSVTKRTDRTTVCTERTLWPWCNTNIVFYAFMMYIRI